MAVTEASLLAAVRRRLISAEPRLRPYVGVLTNAPSTAGTTFSVTNGDAFQAGDIVEGPDGEQSLVVSVSTNDLTVLRAQGDVAAENLAANDLLKKNPRFTHDQILGEVNTTLRELRGNGLYSVTTEAIAYTTDKWYDTATDVEHVVAAWYIDTGASPDERRVPYFKFHMDPQTGAPQVFLAAAGFEGNVSVMERVPYTTAASLSDAVGDIVVAAVCYKMLGMSLATSTTDPSRRTDRTVQGGQEGRDSIWFLREFVRLRDLEIAQQALKEKKVQREFTTQRGRRFIP